MNDAERRLERENQKEINREKRSRSRKILFDVIALATLGFIIFWGFGGGTWVASQMPDKPVSEFFFSLSSGKVDKLEKYVINGFSIKETEDTEDQVPGEEMLEPTDIDSPGAEILNHFNAMRQTFGYSITVLYEKEGKETCTAEQLAQINKALEKYDVGPCTKACRITYSVRISGKKSVIKNSLYEGTATTVRIDGKWYIMPGTLEYSEVTP